MENNEEKNEETKTMNRSSKKKIGKVKVKCGWPSGWVIDDPELGKRRIKDGETVEFDPTDGVQLHNLIQVLRVVNSPRRNITEHKSPDDKRLHIQKRKFEIVEGLEYLPRLCKKQRCLIWNILQQKGMRYYRLFRTFHHSREKKDTQYK